MSSRNEVLIERVYKRLLIESGAPSIEGLAALVAEAEGGGIAAVIYRPSTLFSFLKKDLKNVKDAADESVVAYVAIAPPPGPCHGAWEVKTTAGHGYAKVLYGLGYAMSPNGLLMPDRKDVSPAAYKAWSKVKLSGRESLPLDDMSLPKNKRNTPDDTSDDCKVHKANDGDCRGRDPEPLNSAYKEEGWEGQMMEKLQSSHSAAMKVVALLKADSNEVENDLIDSGAEFFVGKYGKEMSVSA